MKFREELSLMWWKIWHVVLFAYIVAIPAGWCEYRYHSGKMGWIITIVGCVIYVVLIEPKLLERRKRKKQL